MSDKVPLRDFVEHHWANHQREHDRGQDVLDARLHALNELRVGVITRTEYSVQHQILEDRLTALTDRFNTEVSGRRQGGNALWSYIFGGLGLAAAIITVIVLLLR